MIDEFIKTNHLPAFRQKQFNQAFYQQLISSFDEIFNWPKDLRIELNQEFPFSSLKVKQILKSVRGDTIKVLFERQDNLCLEAVLMKHEDGRNTICVSSMVGCPVGCKFCATGKLGFKANLNCREIIDQILYFQRQLKRENKKITNIVFMGMGEPLLNLDKVLQALNIISHPEKLAISSRRVTISTSGYIPQIRQLIETGFRGRIAVSLHASNQKLREELMPVAKLYPLDKLIRVMDEYTKLTNKRISYEYIMIDNVNDQTKNALELVDLFKGKLLHFNLIPLNPIEGEKYKRSQKKNIFKFGQILKKNGIPYSIRVTMGDDIMAACGQLANKS